MAVIDTQGYSVDELKAIAAQGDSPSTSNSVDTQGYSVDELKAIAGTQTEEPSIVKEFTNANDKLSAGLRNTLLRGDFKSGFDNPSKVEKFADLYPQAVMNTLEKSKFLREHPNAEAALFSAAGTPAKLAGMTIDSALSPMDIAGGIVGSRIIQAAIGAAPVVEEAIGNQASKMFTKKFIKPNSADFDNLIIESARDYQKSADVIRQESAAELSNLRSQHRISNQGLQSQIDQVDNVHIPNASDKAALEGRKAYVPIAKDLSERFGGAYKEAIAGEQIPTNDYHEAINNVLNKEGIIRNPQTGEFYKPNSSLSNSQKDVIDLYERNSKRVPGTSSTTQVVMTPGGPQRVTVDVGQEMLSLETVDKELQGIFRSKVGTQYGSGDHILTSLREEVMNTFGDTSSKLAKVRQTFAPELQMKNELYKITQPFNRSGSYDTTSGIKFFTKYANGELLPDEARLIDAMKSKLGNGFLEDLNASASNKIGLLKQKQILANSYPEKSFAAQQKRLSSISRNTEEAQNSLDLIDAMKQNALADEFRKTLIGGLVVGGIAEEKTLGIGRNIIKAVRGG